MSAKGIKKHTRSSLWFYAICGDLNLSLYFKWWFSIRMKQLNNKNFTPKIPYLTPIALNEDVLSISKQLIEKNKESYEVLAK